jgi:hypothetical protein
LLLECKGLTTLKKLTCNTSCRRKLADPVLSILNRVSLCCMNFWLYELTREGSMSRRMATCSKERLLLV